MTASCHGWQFNSSGQCTHIPTLRQNSRIPARARVDVYPAVERYGVIFASLGDLPEAERPPIMDIAQWGQEGWGSAMQTDTEKVQIEHGHHGEKMDTQLAETTLGFEKEDRQVIENMRPHFSPRDTQSELLLPEDQIMVSYRRYLDTWEARGWRIDTDALLAKAHTRVSTVPSPGRREHRNWVLDTVPLRSAKALA